MMGNKIIEGGTMNDIVNLATQIINTKHQEVGSGYSKMLREWSPIEKKLARFIIANDTMISDLRDALNAYPDSDILSLAQSIMIRNEYLENVVNSLCGRCGEKIKDRRQETCFWCHGVLCYECFDKYGHCGHEEADKLNEMARSVKQPSPHN